MNSPPTITDFWVNGTEDQKISFNKTDFSSHFHDDDNDDLIKIKILILPNNGNLLLVDTPIAIDNEISFNLIENLSFMPEKNWFG